MRGGTSRRSDRIDLSAFRLKPEPPPPPLVIDNEPLHDVADGYADVLGAALIGWLRANAPTVRAVLDMEDDDPRG